MRGVVKTLTAKGLQGDTKSANAILGLAQKLLDTDPPIAETTELSVADKKILENYRARLLSTKKVNSEE